MCLWGSYGHGKMIKYQFRLLVWYLCSPDGERWLPVPRYAAFYEASCCGSVYSMPRAGTAGGLLKVQLNSKGLRVVRLSRYGMVRTVTVGSIVLRTFARAPRPGERTQHGPRGLLDDSLANLWWG